MKAEINKSEASVRIPAGEKLRILQLTDMQIIDAAQRRYPERLVQSEIDRWDPALTEKNYYEQMRDVIQQTDPHLILFTGDLIYGSFDDSGERLREFIEKMEETGIPWAPVWGNHDQESALGNEALCRAYENAPHCLFCTRTTDPADGSGNYSVRIYRENDLIEMVYLLDSKGCKHASTPEAALPASITENQCRLIEEASRRADADAGHPVPGIAGWHIPTREFREALTENGYSAKKGMKLGVTEPAKPGDFGSYIDGSFDEKITSPAHFAERLQNCHIRGVFAGHHHCIHYSVTWQGIRWTLGLKIGTYDFYTNGALGGTLIEPDGNSLTVRFIPTVTGYGK